MVAQDAHAHEGPQGFHSQITFSALITKSSASSISFWPHARVCRDVPVSADAYPYDLAGGVFAASGRRSSRRLYLSLLTMQEPSWCS